jgi:hypothetical protein
VTARDLTPTERALRVIVAQHLPGLDPARASSYADRIHLNEPLTAMGLCDVTRIHLGIAVEKAFGFEASDDDVEGCKCVADLAKLVERHTRVEAA